MKSKGTNKRKHWSKQRLQAAFHDFFLVSERERRGLRILSVLILMIWVFKAWIIPLLPAKQIEIGPIERQMLIAHANETSSLKHQFSTDTRYADENLNISERFDPNTVSYDALMEMGLPMRIARTWTNYIRSGARFSSSDDLLKLYGFKPEWLEEMRGYIYFEAGLEPIPFNDRHSTSEIITIELNRADTTALMSLPGIGVKLANRILKFREILGGFHDTLQLLEVYGLDSLTFRRIVNKVIIDTLLIRSLDINQSDFAKLNRHPCVSRELAYEIIEFRRRKGRIGQLEEIDGFNALPEAEQLRLRAYLTIADK